MARIIFNGIPPFNGVLNGWIFQNSAGGPIIRTKSNRIVSNSPSLLTIQQIFTLLAQAWKALPLWRQTEWNTFASSHVFSDNWGVETYITGMQYFMSTGMYTEINQSYYNISPPFFSPVPDVAQFTLNASPTALTIDWPAPFTAATAWLAFYFTPPSRSASIRNTRNIHYAGFQTPYMVTSIDVTTIYETLFSLTWSTLYSAFHGQIMCHLKLIHEDEGICSPYTTSILTLPVP